ncbi:inositol pyrophosphate synthase [Lasallia pustulata]|nr:inositol pyrophosphate synthase [Lasallia pustulata]
MDAGDEGRTASGSSAPVDTDKTPSASGIQGPLSPAPYPSLALPDSALRSSRTASSYSSEESHRLSNSSFYSTGSGVSVGGPSGIHVSGAGSSAAASAPSSKAGSIKAGPSDPVGTTSTPMSPSLGSLKGDASAKATTATDTTPITTSSHTQLPCFGSPSPQTLPVKDQTNFDPPAATQGTSVSRPIATSHRSRSRTQQRRLSGSTAASSASPNKSERGSQRRETEQKITPIGKIGVCALDVKARSKPSRNILTRLQSKGEFEVIVFGDKVILDEDVENWPICDFLLSFFSDGFPLDKAIAYARLRKPFCLNDLPMQKVLWERRICLRILDSMGVPTPRRLEVNRDGGPTLESPELADHMYKLTGVRLDGPGNGMGGGAAKTKKVTLIDDGDALFVDGSVLKKPFVEKPVSGEDHNIRVYYPQSYEGGGGRKLFRKIGNKSSEWDSNLIVPRAIEEEGSSYIYEQFLHVDNAEDVKAYTVGPNFCHAETRKSPVVDGLVRRNTHGKEIRYITSLTEEEALMASKIAKGFGQRICGFDLLRVGTKSYVIDVNGWSFVKDNNEYYDKCASLLRDMFVMEKQAQDGQLPAAETSLEGNLDQAHPQRKNTSSHRSVIGAIMKSPSMSRLAGNHQTSHRPHGTATWDISIPTAPMTSPPSLENRQLPIIPTNSIDTLPPTSIPADPQFSAGADETPPAPVPMPASKHSWKLKGMVAVIRHADRTPKQKFKFTFHTQPFVDLLKGHQEEVLLKGEAALSSVEDAVNVALKEGIEDLEKLKLLKTSLAMKGAWAGTKVQIKPMFRKRKTEELTGEKVGEHDVLDPILRSNRSENESLTLSRTQSKSDSLAGLSLSRFSAADGGLVLDKLQLIIKWGGEPTHSARYQSQDLGDNMRNDLLLMNREVLEDVRVFTSSEKRVSTSAQIWAASFLEQKDVPEKFISVRKDLLDDSNAAKDVMDKVKKKLKLLLREGHQAPPQFAWPENTPEPSIVVRKVAELMRFHRRVMRHNYNKLYGPAAASLTALNKSGEPAPASPGAAALSQAHMVSSIQARWCCGEDSELFKERWEKLFSEFCDSEKIDPSKISELYDTMKFDALHNRQFLEWVFTPSSSILDELSKTEPKPYDEGNNDEPRNPINKSERKESSGLEKSVEKKNFAQRIGLRRGSGSNPQSGTPEESQESYFKLYMGSGQTKAKQDARLSKLRELYKLAKVLFDFVGPQEYGIEDSEKLEIGLLTSLPLLKEIVKDLEEMQASEDAKSFIYFTKESHIYTLLNCILEGGIKTKIERNAIPELDYLSQICFELYESEDKDEDTFAYSIKITITPGCHTFDPLDVQLDSKHSIGCTPRRSLTAHMDWKEVIGTLRGKFTTVKLPKSFLAVNLSERHASDESKGMGGD